MQVGRQRTTWSCLENPQNQAYIAQNIPKPQVNRASCSEMIDSRHWGYLSSWGLLLNRFLLGSSSCEFSKILGNNPEADETWIILLGQLPPVLLAGASWINKDQIKGRRLPKKGASKLICQHRSKKCKASSFLTAGLRVGGFCESLCSTTIQKQVLRINSCLDSSILWEKPILWELQKTFIQKISPYHSLVDWMEGLANMDSESILVKCLFSPETMSSQTPLRTIRLFGEAENHLPRSPSSLQPKCPTTSFFTNTDLSFVLL